MTVNLFEFDSYRLFLKAYLSNQINAGHGLRAKWAKEIGCHTTYVSQILNEKAHLSLEQSIRLTHILSLDDNQSGYFLALVNFGKAGTIELQNFYAEEVKIRRERNQHLRHRVSGLTQLTTADSQKYYSAWYYAAIHMAVAIARLNNVERIMIALGLSKIQVEAALLFLESCKLIEMSEGIYIPSQTQLHLPHDSEAIIRHHTNWRIKAMQSLDQAATNDLHYSSVISAAEQDIPKIKNILTDAITMIREVVKSSKSERVYSYCIDLFPVSSK